MGRASIEFGRIFMHLTHNSNGCIGGWLNQQDPLTEELYLRGGLIVGLPVSHLCIRVSNLVHDQFSKDVLRKKTTCTASIQFRIHYKTTIIDLIVSSLHYSEVHIEAGKAMIRLDETSLQF